MNKKTYQSAIDNLKFNENLNDKIVNNLEQKNKNPLFFMNARRISAVCAAVVCVFAVVFGFSALNKSDFTLMNSSGDIQVKYINNAPNMKRSYDLIFLSEGEIFNKYDTLIFKGTVLEINNIKIDFNGSAEYRAIAKIKVEKVYRGNEAVGESVSVLLPCPIGKGIWVEDTETVSVMQVGTEGIFMPIKYNENHYREENETRLYYSDLTPYGFLDGARFAFISSPNGLIFDRYAFPSITQANSMQEIEQYVLTMLSK